MGAAALAGFLAIAAAGAYVQTLTGFAFGLVMMGSIALFSLLPLTDAATMVGILALVNTIQMLVHGGWRQVTRRELALTLVTSLPCVVAGYFLVEHLADTRADLLKLLLGLVIMVSSIQLALKPQPLARISSAASFLGFGTLSGLMSGLFSTSGPPLVYHFFRQPMPLAVIRETLVACFGCAAALRLALVVGTGNLPPPSTLAGALAIPVVMAATYAARRWPPPISAPVMRRIVFVLLFLSGLALALPAGLHLAGIQRGL